HDWTEAEHGAFDSGFDDVLMAGLLHAPATGAKLIDVLKHDDAGLHGDAEQSEEPHSRRNREVGVGDEERERTADRSHDDAAKNEHRPLKGAEHGVENQ